VLRVSIREYKSKRSRSCAHSAISPRFAIKMEDKGVILTAAEADVAFFLIVEDNAGRLRSRERGRDFAIYMMESQLTTT
jgi:hypothetical protein